LQEVAVLIRCLPVEFNKFQSEIKGSLPYAEDGGRSDGIACNQTSADRTALFESIKLRPAGPKV
jgi:hypothetical protein